MVYVSRKIVFPFFVVVFTIAFISLLYFVFLNQPLKVADNPAVYVVGDKILLKMTILNVSNNRVNDIAVIIKSSSGQRTLYLGNDITKSYLDANSSYDFVAELPLSDDTKYSIVISAPLNKSIILNVELKDETIKPVEMTLEEWKPRQVVGVTNTFPVKLCNVSGSVLSDVTWGWTSYNNSFKEEEIDRLVGLGVSECKSFFFTLTPIRDGNIAITFYWRVGNLERKQTEMIIVSPSGN